MALAVKNSPTNAGDIRDAGSIPGLGRSGGGRGNPLQYSCLENRMDRGAWWATVHRVAKSQTQLKWQHTCTNVWLHILQITIYSYMEGSPFFFLLYQWFQTIPSYGYAIIYFPTDQYLSCFQFVAFTTNAFNNQI